jgi:hypothetical protein
MIDQLSVVVPPKTRPRAGRRSLSLQDYWDGWDWKAHLLGLPGICVAIFSLRIPWYWLKLLVFKEEHYGKEED